MSMFRRRLLMGALARNTVSALSERVGHAGTEDDPIPFEPPMELFSGKYYTQNGVTYLCMRDSETPMSYDLTELVGLYVELVE